MNFSKLTVTWLHQISCQSQSLLAAFNTQNIPFKKTLTKQTLAAVYQTIVQKKSESDFRYYE